MPRRPLDESADVLCTLCGSHGKPAGEGYCEECRPLRARYLAEIEARGVGSLVRRAMHRLTGIDAGRSILGAVLIGALLAIAMLLLTLGG